MNVVSIKDYDVNNGDGFVVSLWVSGCPHRCKGCHNEHYWNKNTGRCFTKDDLENIKRLLQSSIHKDFSILGGEPLTSYNVEQLVFICQEVKRAYPDKKIWIWTGYTYEEILKDKDKFEILQYIDILVDGKFIESKKDLSLRFKGSTNQKIIDVQESLKKNKIILSKYN